MTMPSCGLKSHIWTVNVISLFLVLLFLFVAQPGHAANGPEVDSREVSAREVNGVSNKNPGSDLWRNVRQRDFAIAGISQIKNVDSDILINPQADKWARFRMNTLISYGMYVLAAIVLSILLFYLIRGRVNIEGGLSGRMVKRFDEYERTLHWTLAIVFIFLACTGLVLLLGRNLLIPLLGHDIFSIVASASKEAHNLFGPVFIFSLLLMLFRFVKRNIYEKGDLTWLMKGGGFIGKSHVSGGFFNMGEKTLYWIVILAGLIISISGLILLFPGFGQGRVIMELSHVVHAIGAILLIAVIIGHIYLASIGTEGTLESMKTGYSDIKWVEAHHDRWARQCHDNNRIISAEEYARLQGKEEINLSDAASVAMEKNE